MPAQQDWLGSLRYHVQLASALNKPLLRSGVIPFFARNPLGVAAQRISLGDPIQKIEFALARQAAKGAVTDFFAFLKELAWLQMIAHQSYDLRPHVITFERVNVQPVPKIQRQINTRFFVSARAQAAVDEFRSPRLAKIMRQSGQHYRDLLSVRKIANQLAGSIDYQTRMNKDVAFRMPFGILWHFDQSFDFRKELIQDAQSVQPTQSDRWMLSAQQELFHLAPDAFTGQVGEIYRAAEGHGFRFDSKLKSGRELRRAQNAQPLVSNFPW